MVTVSRTPRISRRGQWCSVPTQHMSHVAYPHPRVRIPACPHIHSFGKSPTYLWSSRNILWKASMEGKEVPVEKPLHFSCVLVWLGLLMHVNRAWWASVHSSTWRLGLRLDSMSRPCLQTTTKNKYNFKTYFYSGFQILLYSPLALLRCLLPMSWSLTQQWTGLQSSSAGVG